VSLIVILTACGSRGDTPPPTATSFIDPSLLTVQPGEFNPAPFGEEEDTLNFSATANPGLDLTLEALGAPTRNAPVEGRATALPFGGIGNDVPMPPAGEIDRIDQSDVQFDAETAPTPTVFNFVEIYRGGGITDDDFRIRISNDGTVTENGVPTRNVGPQAVNQINELMNEIDIYTIRGQFFATIPRSEDYQYIIQVKRGGTEFSIRADDTLIPRELSLFIAEVLQITQGIAPPPPPPTR
jgi:hypothetical protein